MYGTVDCWTTPAPFLQNAISTLTSALHPDTIARTGDPPGALRSHVELRAFNRKWRLHDEMQDAIRPDEQREILVVAIQIVASRGPGDSGNLEDSLCVLKQRVHAGHLSAAIGFFALI
jgi:hypothetical protein